MGDASLPRTVYRSEETREIFVDYLNYHLTNKGYEEWNPRPQLPVTVNAIHTTMRTLGDQFHVNYQDKFNEMCQQLHITPDTAQLTFHGVVSELFREGGIQWSKIVALFAFGSAFAARCMYNEMPMLVNSVVDWVTDYVDQHLSQWIDEHGSWNGFVEYFDSDTHQDRHREIVWPTIKNFVCGVAAGAIGVLTIGAVLTSR